MVCHLLSCTDYGRTWVVGINSKPSRRRRSSKGTATAATGNMSVAAFSVPGEVAIVAKRSSPVSSKSREAEESLDELQSLNTALCFLCSINADVHEVENFLVTHPEALLLEGTNSVPEESAHFIVEEQMRQCECFSLVCNQNRTQVLLLLDRGYEYFQTRNFSRRPDDCISWSWYSDELVFLEGNIRRLRVTELTLRNKVVETSFQVRKTKNELDMLQKLGSQQQKMNLSLLACARHEPNNDAFARKSVLEYQVGVASVSLTTAEREHKELLRDIRLARRRQFTLLKKAFVGVRRHVCATATMPQKMHQIVNTEPRELII